MCTNRLVFRYDNGGNGKTLDEGVTGVEYEEMLELLAGMLFLLFTYSATVAYISSPSIFP